MSRADELAAPLLDYQWKNRIILVNVDKVDLGLKQVERFSVKSEQNEERHLIVMPVDEKRSEVSRAYAMKPGAFKVVLIGKDGGVKATYSEPVEPDAIYELIDSMPMRQDEMKRKK
ncbi:MAG: DUF4174 domain-containing protein [Pseudomonadota bacterium]